MDKYCWTTSLDESAMAALAGSIGAELRGGDAVALSGDLGAGKSTLARALIRVALGDETAEVPSPTFSLAQCYETPRLNITHYDFYRLGGADEAREIGFDEALALGAVLVEWPERASDVLPDERLEVAFEEIEDGRSRQLTLTGHGRWADRLARLAEIRGFVEGAGWGQARVAALAGDASARRYLRLFLGGESRVLMDAPRQADGPPIRDGKPYSRIAHLAEDVRPFVAVARYLKGLGLSAPDIRAMDLDDGLLLTEDLGDRVYGTELSRGADQSKLWHAAAEALHVVRRATVPASGLEVGDGTFHLVPAYDRGAMQIEVELVLDWYVPAVAGSTLPEAARSEFVALWDGVFDRILALPTSLVLRDYHSPNLLVLEGRTGAARVGIIDFQDSLIGHAAYDLVSLLQDARVDVPAGIETDVLAAYLTTAAREPDFDRDAFRFAYAALGAQRNTKILGIFARLAKRDGKPAYLRHIPRIWGYLERDLRHGELAALAAWYERHLPAEIRAREALRLD